MITRYDTQRPQLQADNGRETARAPSLDTLALYDAVIGATDKLIDEIQVSNEPNRVLHSQVLALVELIEARADSSYFDSREDFHNMCSFAAQALSSLNRQAIMVTRDAFKEVRKRAAARNNNGKLSSHQTSKYTSRPK